jgi:hypothetical protein
MVGRRWNRACFSLLVMSCLSLVGLAQQLSPLVINAPPSQPAVAGMHLSLQLAASGGSAPYTWHVESGTLPPGVKLHSHSGAISGVPQTPGGYHFTVGVVDSGSPQMTVKRDITLTVVGAVSIDWKQYPKVQGNAINGSVVVSNQTTNPLDLTVIIVAVNSIGRATAMGYQHFTIPAQTTDQVIPFGATPGPESYVVHADAVAHLPEKGHVFRARKQTTIPLQITTF